MTSGPIKLFLERERIVQGFGIRDEIGKFVSSSVFRGDYPDSGDTGDPRLEGDIAGVCEDIRVAGKHRVQLPSGHNGLPFKAKRCTFDYTPRTTGRVRIE